MEKQQMAENSRKEALYRKLVNAAVLDELKDKILYELVVKKKFKDVHCTAVKLAEELGTNTRYMSAVARVHFHMTFPALINKYRVEEAMALLADSRYADKNVDEIGYMAGFLHRQTFHVVFANIVGTTPRGYRVEVARGKHMAEQPKSDKK